MPSDSSPEPAQDLASIADAIRKIHGICEKRESQVVDNTIARPKSLRWLKIPYGLAAMVALIGYILILSQVEWKTVGWAEFHLRFVWAIFACSLVYTISAFVVGAFYGWKSVREDMSAFSREDGRNLENEMRSDVELARFDPSILQLVSSWLETRSKRIENQMNWLKGSAGMAVAMVTATLLEKSPLRVKVMEWFALPGVLSAQMIAFSGLLGVLVAMVVVGKRASNCSNRALHLRRILTERNTFLGM